MGKRSGMPPLGALSAFDSAYRHGNFSAAGQELSLTPAAISHQVRLLEEWAGRPLFERRPNGVELTAAGRELGRRVQALLDEAGALGPHVRAQRDPQRVSIRCQLSLGSRWLAPRVLAFRRQHPECQVHLRAEPAMADPLAGRADMSLYYPRPGEVPTGTPLVRGRFVVAAAPSFLRGFRRRHVDAALIAESPLINFAAKDRSWPEPGWSAWFRCAGLQASPGQHMLTTSMMNIAIDMCIGGGGFALVHEALAADDLACGRLVIAHPLAMPAPHTYHLNVRATSAIRPEVQAFERFLLSQSVP